jgi:transposase-like protein
VDQDGNLLDIMVQSRRDKKAAKKFFRKLLKGSRFVPRVIMGRGDFASKRSLIDQLKGEFILPESPIFISLS